MDDPGDRHVPVETEDMVRTWRHRVLSYRPTLAGRPLEREGCTGWKGSQANLAAVAEKFGAPVRVEMRLNGATFWTFDNGAAALVCSGFGAGHEGPAVFALAGILAPLVGVSEADMYEHLAALEYAFFGLLWEAGWGLAEMPGPRY
jgi:hypothetical protein